MWLLFIALASFLREVKLESHPWRNQTAIAVEFYFIFILAPCHDYIVFTTRVAIFTKKAKTQHSFYLLFQSYIH